LDLKAGFGAGARPPRLNFSVDSKARTIRFSSLKQKNEARTLNSELSKKALEKVQNPNILVNIISRRVRQLNSGGPSGRPLIADTAGLGAADIALLELIEGKLTWEAVEPGEVTGETSIETGTKAS
jgi:DNA-directed RNA polymerase subunit omega